jgi:hypothetical protein
MLIHSAEITGSVQFNNTDVSGITNVSSFATTASVDAVVVKTGSFATTSSVNDLQSKTGSYATTSSINDLQSKTGSYTSTSSFGDYTSSNDSTNTTQNARIAANEAKTGSYATTGSNTFIGTNVFTGSVYITSDLIVQGSSSLQNITASAVSIGTNTVILNTNTPILQFGGISVQDSGSTAGRSGSLLWNSVNDHWINVNPSGSDEGYNSAMVINGPKNTGSLGAEVGLTTNYVPVSQGEDHITDSIIFQSGSTNIGIGTTTPTARLEVAGTSKFGITSANTHQFTGSVFISSSNAALLNINSDILYVSSSGNIGIGVTSISPISTYKTLEIRGATGGGIKIGKTGFNPLNIQHDGTDAYLNNVANGSFNIYTNDAPRVIVTSAGNVGIGTTNAVSTLTVNRSSSGNAATFVAGTSNLVNEYSGITLSANVQGADIWYASEIRSINTNSTPDTLNPRLGFFTQNTGTYLPANRTEKMTILGNGNVGIGTNNPSYLLHVNGNAYVSNTLYGGVYEGTAGQICASVPYGSTTISYNLASLPIGLYLVTAYMVRGGAAINETYSYTWMYYHFSGGTDVVTGLGGNPGPSNNNGGVSISGTTITVGWGGARGPAAVVALRLRDAF